MDKSHNDCGTKIVKIQLRTSFSQQVSFLKKVLINCSMNSWG